MYKYTSATINLLFNCWQLHPKQISSIDTTTWMTRLGLWPQSSISLLWYFHVVGPSLLITPWGCFRLTLTGPSVTAFIIAFHTNALDMSSIVCGGLWCFLEAQTGRFRVALSAFIEASHWVLTSQSRTGAPVLHHPPFWICPFDLMHQALRISELMDQISWHTDRSSLPSLALTCHAFEGPALDALWRDLPSIEPLVNCIPGELVSNSYSGYFSHSVICVDTRYQGLGHFS